MAEYFIKNKNNIESDLIKDVDLKIIYKIFKNQYMLNEQITELLDDIDNSLLLNSDDEDFNNNKIKFYSESESEEIEQNIDMLEDKMESTNKIKNLFLEEINRDKKLKR